MSASSKPSSHRIVRQYKAPENLSVQRIAFSPNGNHLAVIYLRNDNNTSIVKVIDRNGTEKELQFDHWVRAISFSANNNELACGGTDNKLTFIDTTDMKIIGTPIQIDDEIMSIAYANNGKYFATGESKGIEQNRTIGTGESNGRIGIFNATTKIIRELNCKGGIRTVSFTTDSKHVIGGSGEGKLHIFEMETFEEVKQIDIGGRIMSSSVSPNGEYVAFCGTNKKVTVINTNDWSKHKKMTLSNEFNSVSFSADGNKLAVDGEDKMVTIYNPHSGKVVSKINFGHQVIAFAFSPLIGDDRLAVHGRASTWKIYESSERPRLWNDDVEVEDQLNVKAEVIVLADCLASKLTEPPFVIGIFGPWGSGKSFCFNLIRKQLINIQKQPANRENEDFPYAGHLYLVCFRSWTYSKGDLWSSLMYKILNDVSDQLDLESVLEKKYKNCLTEGTHSTIELLLDRKKLTQEAPNFKFNRGEVTKSLEEIFEDNNTQDKNDLVEAERDLIKAKNRVFWKELFSDYTGEEGDPIKNYLHNKVYGESSEEQPPIDNKTSTNGDGTTNDNVSTEEGKSEHSHIPLYYKLTDDAKKNSGNQSFLQIYNKIGRSEMFSLVRKSRKLYGVKLIVNVILIVAVFCVLAGLIVMLSIYVNDETARIGAILISISTFIVYTLYKVKDSISKIMDDTEKALMEEFKRVKEKTEDVEAGGQSGEDIHRLLGKISNIKARMKVVEGESITNFVNQRLQSNDYADNLGVIHQAQLDLQALSDAMLHPTNIDKFPRGNARVIIEVDDLDRCMPDLVVAVLEALQLLVNTGLFVVVVAIDPRYVCTTLETKIYKDILHRNKSPTGMDFLEKIIQIPYGVPMINEDAVEAFVDSQIKVEIKEVDDEGEGTDLVDLDRQRDDEVEETSEPADQPPATVLASNDQVLQQLNPRTEEHFSIEEAKMLKEACKAFKLTPRAMKRTINIFKLLKCIWGMRAFNGKAKDFINLKRDTLLFLVLISSEMTRNGIQKVFVAMEENYSKPNGVQTLNDFVKNCLKESKCDDGIDRLFQLSATTYFGDKIDTKDGWRIVVKNFRLARSFSFFYNSEEEDDIADHTKNFLYAHCNQTNNMAFQYRS